MREVRRSLGVVARLVPGLPRWPVSEPEVGGLELAFGLAKDRKRKRTTSPTARMLEWCRKHGWQAAVVERRLPIPRSRIPVLKDAFGFGDVLALDDRQGAVLLQVTSDRGGGHSGARIEKIREQCGTEARRWLERGNRIYVVGWAKRGPRGGTKRWAPRFIELVLEGERIVDEERAELAQGA